MNNNILLGNLSCNSTQLTNAKLCTMVLLPFCVTYGYQIPSAWALGLLTCKCGRAFRLNCRYRKPYMCINNLKLYWTGYLYKPTRLKEFTVDFFLLFKLHDRTNIDTFSAKSQREFFQWPKILRNVSSIRKQQTCVGGILCFLKLCCSKEFLYNHTNLFSPIYKIFCNFSPQSKWENPDKF